MIAQLGIGAGQREVKVEQYYEKGTTWIEFAAEGVASRTFTRHLARNALVRRYTLRAGATRADRTTLSNSGQVRKQADTGDGMIIVVDFGMLRTVSDVGRVGGAGAPTLKICSLRAFLGSAFDTVDLYLEDCSTDDPDAIMVRTAEQNSFETRTEKVRIKVQSTADLQTLSDAIWLSFPDLPTDLDIRIGGGAPVWTAPGVAQPNTHGWGADAHQVVDLTNALAAMAGDPHDDTQFDASIVLASRIPGTLTLDQEFADIAYLARVAFGQAEDTTLTLEEGQYDVVLGLPAWMTAVQEVRLTLTGSVPPERILQPVGPPLALLPGGSGAAYQLQLDVDHAGAVRLDPAAPFAELSALRLPLVAGPDGAEVRAVLHEGTADAPVRPVPNGTSSPVELTPPDAGSADPWITLPLPKSVKLDSKTIYWIVLAVGRGSASWSLGRAEPGDIPVPILRGAAAGPWHPLPDIALQDATLEGRVRAVGKPRPETPVAPLSLTVVGGEAATVDVTPTPKGQAAAWVAAGAVSGNVHPSVPPGASSAGPYVTLRLTSRIVGSVKLSGIDVVGVK